MKKCNSNRGKILLLLLIVPVLSGFHWWDPIARWVGIGNKAVEAGEFETARDAYQKAAETAPGDERILNNRGVVEYSQQNFEEAAKYFDTASASRDSDVSGTARYNRGCAQMKGGDLQGAVESFVEALKINPDDEDAKVNLEMALQMLQQMPTPTPQQQQDQDQDQPKPSGTPEGPTSTPDPEQTQQQQDQTSEVTSTPTAAITPTPQANADSVPSPTPSGSPSASMEPQPEETAMPTPEDGMMSVSEAERLLDAQEEEEMDVRKKFHQLPSVKDRVIEKDW